MLYILPEPKKMDMTDEKFVIENDVEIHIYDDRKNENKDKLFSYARLLKNSIGIELGYIPTIGKDSADSKNGAVNLQVDDSLDDQMYNLTISTEGVIIKGGSVTGVLYGIQSLRQIISQAGAVLPGLYIEDYPDIKNRGFLYDATRGRIDKLSFYKHLADTASFYKLNQLQLYIEHTFLFHDYTEVCRDDTPLLAEDILELDSYCESIGVELIPSIESFGHLHKLLTTRTYGHMCEIEGTAGERFGYGARMVHYTINPTDEKALRFMEEKIAEFASLFRSKYFNINADETFDLGKGKSRSAVENSSRDEVYIRYVSELCRFVKSLGRIPMIWEDILVGNPKMTEELPEDVICLTWGYNENEQDINASIIAKTGKKQYLCPGIHSWRHLINRHDTAYLNIKRMCLYAKKYDAIGVLNTAWGDYGHIADPDFIVPGLIYGAAFSWNTNVPDRTEINKKISIIEYGDKSGEFTDLVTKLSQGEAFEWANMVQYSETTEFQTDDEMRKNMIMKLTNTEVLKKNGMLDDCIRQLYEKIRLIDKEKRYVIGEYILFAEGQKLLNILGANMREYVCKEKCEGSVKPADLADMLERWFMKYKENWRKKSRESELFRIQERIFWYTDLLRTMEEA